MLTQPIAGYGNVKDNYDSGQFKAIQKAGVYALDHPEITGRIGAKYERRLKSLVVDIVTVFPPDTPLLVSVQRLCSEKVRASPFSVALTVLPATG